MITLQDDDLHFRFPEVHEDAQLRIQFQRTLRIPDDGQTHGLPPGLGAFPLRHVDDFADRVPEAWKERGGVMLPMYQAEALWISFRGSYPMLVRIAAGKINAVTGEPWTEATRKGVRQDYVVIPKQPWLDGYCTEQGVIRQFVAMPLGEGYTPEEQLTGKAEFGGIQVMVHPLRREAWEKILKLRKEWRGGLQRKGMADSRVIACFAPDMGLAMGGRMRQEIYDDTYAFQDWDLSQRSRCYVHLTNSLVWKSITGEAPPTTPPTAAEYTRAGLPWFEYYGEGQSVLKGSSMLAGTKSVAEWAAEQGTNPLPENESVSPQLVINLGKKPAPSVVREGEF
jgi:hypothetical protein